MRCCMIYFRIRCCAYCIVFLNIFLLFFVRYSFSSDKKIEEVTRDIVYECTLPNNSVVGRPLPLASHWNVGLYKDGYGPWYQIGLIKKGYRILPWLKMPKFSRENEDESKIEIDRYYKYSISFFKKYGLPISFVGTQWESLLSLEKEFFYAKAGVNQNKRGRFGFEKKLDPLSSSDGNHLWYKVGKKWVTGPQLKKIQKMYTNPPLIIFLSNNEHKKEKWYEIEDARYLRHGLKREKLSDEEKKRTVGEAWIRKYNILIESMRENIANKKWRENSLFIGYDSYGNRMMGKSNNWQAWSLNVDGLELPGAFVWDGTSSSLYLSGEGTYVDHTYSGILIEAMNYSYLFKNALNINPNAWIEISVWDGGKEQRAYRKKKGQAYTPERYRGMVQYAMWLLRPRVIREFRAYNDTVEGNEPYFYSILDSVNFVYDNDVLKRFWRKGVNVVNTSVDHPYTLNISENVLSERKWFLLNNSANKFPVRNDNKEIFVYSIALSLGSKPNREWLVYSFSPNKVYTNCEVQINGNEDDKVTVSVNSSQSGIFSHIVENKRYAVTELKEKEK